MADVPLDDAASFDAFGARLAPPSPGSSAPAANPFDGFEDFAAPAANALSLPPPAPVASTAVSLGSPLISFSPLAVAPATTDAPALASSTSSSNNNAVDDLLSFSPVATAPLSAGPSSFLTIDDFFLSSTATTTGSALSNESSSGGVGVFDAIDISSSTVESGSSPSVSTLPQTEQMKAPGLDTFEAAEENVRGSSSGDNGIQNSSLLGETSFTGDSGHLPLSPLPTQLDLLATTPFNSLEVTGETARDSFGGFDMIKEPSSINETGHLSPSPLLTQTDLLDVTEETGRGSFGGFDMTKGSRPINETGQLSPTPLPTQTGALAPSTFDSLETTTENVRGSYVGLDMVPRSESDLESPLTSSTNSLPTIPATSDAVAPLGVNSSAADTQVIDSNIHNVRIEVQVTETTVSVSEIVSAEIGSERSEAPTVFAESRASSPSVSVDTLQAQTVPESSTGDFISSDSVHVETKTASVAVVQNESQTIGRDSDDQDQELRVDSYSPKDPVKLVEHTHTLDTKVNGDGSSELDADIHAEEIAPDATRSQEAFAQQPLIGSEKVTLEPIVGQEVHSALSFHNTPSEDDPRDLSEHGVDDFEGDFEAEFHAIDAEVADGVENTSLEHVESHESPMHIHIQELHSPPTNNVALSPSSVVSSPGSSVEGSAFAFISAVTSAALPFSQTENSPLEKEPEDISDDFAHRESIDNEIYPNASVDDHHDEVVSAQDGLVEGANQSENIARDSQEVIGLANEFGVYGEVHDQNSGTLVGDKEESAERVDPGSKPFDESVSSSDFGGFGGGFVSNEWSDSVAVTSDAPTASFGFETFSSSTVNETSGIGADDDDFGGFAQSTTTAVDEGDDDFGDFGTASSWGGGGVAIGNDDDDDDFGDFTPSTTSQQWDTVVANSTPSPEWTPTPEPPKPDPIPTDMNHFFGVAFPASKAPYAASLIPKPTSFHSGSTSAISALSILEQTSALHKNFHASLQDYRSLLAGDNDDSNHHHYQPPFEAEAVRLKYLKYVLTEKLSEASRHDGVFPQGSEQYRLYEAIAESGHEKNMREALSKLQEALFHSSVNEAVMRIARQAALSAKARIAEQAAQQQAHARGSLLATTRNFLSRGSNEKDRTASGSLGVLTPTGASVHKISRFSSNGQEGEGQSSGYGSGEDTGSDISAGDSSNFSESDLGVGASPPTSTSSSGRSGGLMKKFHERFSFSSSTKNKQRTVSLRRMGQSNEEVCKMELNMESINGGFDEVKWRCAGFLYETEDVARLAPSQIKIYSYPSNQLLTGKTDRSALSKFFKPGTIWSIDIGVSSE